MSQLICPRCFIECPDGDSMFEHIEKHLKESARRKIARARRNMINDLKPKLLNLIEQSKDKSLPLTWLTGEIKKL